MTRSTTPAARRTTVIATEHDAPERPGVLIHGALCRLEQFSERRAWRRRECCSYGVELELSGDGTVEPCFDGVEPGGVEAE